MAESISHLQPSLQRLQLQKLQRLQNLQPGEG